MLRNSPGYFWVRLLGALSGIGLTMGFWFAFAAPRRDLDQAATEFAALPSAEQIRLLRTAEHFHSLPPAEQSRMRRLHRSVSESPELQERLQTVYNWYQKQDAATESRLAGLRTGDADAWVEAVEELYLRDLAGRPNIPVSIVLWRGREQQQSNTDRNQRSSRPHLHRVHFDVSRQQVARFLEAVEEKAAEAEKPPEGFTAGLNAEDHLIVARLLWIAENTGFSSGENFVNHIRNALTEHLMDAETASDVFKVDEDANDPEKMRRFLSMTASMQTVQSLISHFEKRLAGLNDHTPTELSDLYESLSEDDRQQLMTLGPAEVQQRLRQQAISRAVEADPALRRLAEQLTSYQERLFRMRSRFSENSNRRPQGPNSENNRSPGAEQERRRPRPRGDC